MRNKNLLLVMVLFIVLFNSIVYSALNSEMFINGDAHIRVDKDIRITNVKVLEQVNGSYETYNSDYSKNTTSMQVTLPSSESVMVYEITITNKGDIDYEVTNIVEESYSNNNIKYELIDIEKGEVIDGGTTHTFKIKFTTTENNTDNKTILVLKYNFKEWVPSLYNMVAHKSRDLDTDIDFGVAPTIETSGVYEMNSTKDDEYPVYYYRGMVDNNNVSFAGFCWKIVRTTSTEGVKLIYNGIPKSDGSCNNTEKDSTIGISKFNLGETSINDFGYIYDNGTDSEIKKVIDKWYSDNMIEYTNMLEDTIWCNDRSIYNIDGSNIYYGAYRRLNSSPYQPSIMCTNENDKYTVDIGLGNGLLIYPVGLLTADEATLAGNGNKGYSELSYLNISVSWWLITPWFFVAPYAYDSIVNMNSDLYYWGVGSNNNKVNVYARPSVSLASGTMIKEGNGSVTNPYKLVEEKMPTEWSFDYTGEEQEFVVPYDGEYKIELWGAGIEVNNYLASGGYTSGKIKLSKLSNLFVYVGGKGDGPNTVLNGGYNGGGNVERNSLGASGVPGGGATDIRLVSGKWNDFNSLKSRIIVAGGGTFNGPAGGLIGYHDFTGSVSSVGLLSYSGKGGTQIGGGLAPLKYTVTCIATSTGSSGGFGFGGSGGAQSVNDTRPVAQLGGGAGGGGYYGGSGGSGICSGVMPGGGGSSFISGHNGCDAIKEESTEDNIIHTGQCIHYSGYKFNETIMVDGAGYNWTNTKGEYVEMPSRDGKSTIVGNTGNGYAKITLIEKK